jgi:hypothetical protein
MNGPPVVVGTGLPLTAPGEAGDELAGVWPCPDPPPAGGVLTVPHPAASAAMAASEAGTSRPDQRVRPVTSVNCLSRVLGVIM